MKSSTNVSTSRALRALADRVSAERRRVEARRLRDARTLDLPEREPRFVRSRTGGTRTPAT